MTPDSICLFTYNGDGNFTIDKAAILAGLFFQLRKSSAGYVSFKPFYKTDSPPTFPITFNVGFIESENYKACSVELTVTAQRLIQMKGVDWHALKDAGIDFVICRTGYGKNGFDETFQLNVNEAHAAGLKCGAYHYSYALTPADAIIEADFCKRIIAEAGVLLELPVFFDMEDDDLWKKYHGFNFSKRNVTAICRVFLDTIKPLDCGVYASYSWLKDYIDWRSLGCAVWNAQWGRFDDFKGYMWQFTDWLLIGGKFFDGNI